jgi:tripartite-type tricarboxylate transporter receptor subunit TctC
VKQAHGGIGSSSDMACILLSSQTGAKPTQVAYRGTGPAMNDLIGGHVDYFCEQAVSVTGQINAGAIKAYAASSPQRLATLPGVPTAKELGVNYIMDVWAGIFAPKGVGQEIVDRLADALDKTLDDPGVQKRLADLGGAIPGKDERSPAKFDAFVKAEIARWSPILKAASP